MHWLIRTSDMHWLAALASCVAVYIYANSTPARSLLCSTLQFQRSNDVSSLQKSVRAPWGIPSYHRLPFASWSNCSAVSYCNNQFFSWHVHACFFLLGCELLQQLLLPIFFFFLACTCMFIIGSHKPNLAWLRLQGTKKIWLIDWLYYSPVTNRGWPDQISQRVYSQQRRYGLIAGG